MAQTSQTRRFDRGRDERRSGNPRAPAIAFDLTLGAAVVAWVIAALTLESEAVLPLVTGVLFLLAGATALWAWSTRRRTDPRDLTFWDIAGALTLIGICTAALVEPDQLVRLVVGANSER